MLLLLLPVAWAGLRDLLPTDPVLEPAQRALFDHFVPSTAVYQGPPRVDFPVLPVQVFGVRYALDVVLVGDDDAEVTGSFSR